MKISVLLAALALTCAPALALADKGHAHGAQGHGDEARAWGKPGKASKASRTITINMTDDMRFSPMDLRVTAGETIRFVVVNKGRLDHEMVIGDLAELKAHAEEMRKNPGMEHEEEDGVEVKPGKRGELVWEFGKPGRFHFACLIPGHFEAGMVGRITVAAKSAR